ncbi:MAG: hypothetical protein SFX73_16955 [Kofleriaceae bacterium]|nr:hypothetical protein [Kofleriaceae bacterium]
MLVETVFQYRTLLGKCELGVGLDWEEIELVTSLEAAFTPDRKDLRSEMGRKYRRQIVAITAHLRGDRINDRVELTEIGPGGFLIRNAPYIARGELVEIMVDEGAVTYRFCARGVWLREDGDDYRVGLRLVGLPVCIHRVSVSAKHEEDVVERIGVAA